MLAALVHFEACSARNRLQDELMVFDSRTVIFDDQLSKLGQNFFVVGCLLGGACLPSA